MSKVNRREFLGAAAAVAAMPSTIVVGDSVPARNFGPYTIYMNPDWEKYLHSDFIVVYDPIDPNKPVTEEDLQKAREWVNAIRRIK